MFPYKDDNPTRTVPFVTIAIIALNILVFMFQLTAQSDSKTVLFSFGAIPYNLISHDSTQPIPAWMTLFTSMFMHGGFFHIFGNMLYLWIFGNNIEDVLGHGKFVIFYLFCGIIAALSHTITNPSSTIPMVGASGAVSGVLGAYLILYPHARIHTIIFLGFFVQTVRIPALIVIGFWAIIQVVNGLVASGVNHGGVAWFAHVGGFLSGLFIILLWRKRRPMQW